MTTRVSAAPAAVLGCALAVLIAPSCSPPQQEASTERPDVTEIGLQTADSLVAAWIGAGTVPGAVLSVARNGEVIFEKAYGYAQASPPLDMQATTVFDLASVTKVMATTFAIMLLVDRRLVALETPVHEILPDFVEGAKSDITLRHLLTHRAGLHPWQPTYYAASNADEAYEFIRDLPLLGAPGAERRYSDLGFMLLGRIVEQISGRRLDDFLEAELYAPLGLTYTSFRPTGSAGVLPPEFAATSHGNPFERRMVHDTAFGYRFAGDPDGWGDWRDHQLVGEVNDGNAHHAFNGVAGHAGLFSNAPELQQLLQVLIDEGEVRSGGEARQIVSPETLRLFMTEVVEGQAVGWQVPDFAPVGSFTHTGFTGTWVIGIPSLQLSAVLLTNRQNHGVNADTRYPDLGALQRSVGEALIQGS